MKKYILISLSIISLLFFNACSGSRILNVDTFCYRFNIISQSNSLSRACFVTEEKDGELYSYCTTEDNTLIEIIHDKNTMNIKKINIVTENISDKYTDIILSSLISLSDISRNEAENIINELISENQKEYANKMHTLEYVTVFFTKTLSGNLFSISYNEEIPTETTTLPETATEYTFEKH